MTIFVKHTAARWYNRTQYLVRQPGKRAITVRTTCNYLSDEAIFEAVKIAVEKGWKIVVIQPSEYGDAYLWARNMHQVYNGSNHDDPKIGYVVMRST